MKSMNSLLNRMPLAALALPLAACQMIPASDVSSASDQIYTARGNEPGWILKMNGNALDYVGDYGETRIAVAAPEVRASFNGMRYISNRLTVDVTYSHCTDDMSGKRFADTVTVLTDGKQVRGCGGRALPTESLNDTTWTIVMVDQLPVLDSAETEVRFTDERVSGSAGCNRFKGTYSVSNNVLSFGPIVSMRMMCPEKQMAQEARFLALLSGPVTQRYSVEGNLILANDKGNRATLRQVL